jgi:hypothetical protein
MTSSAVSSVDSPVVSFLLCPRRRSSILAPISSGVAPLASCVLRSLILVLRPSNPAGAGARLAGDHISESYDSIKFRVVNFAFSDVGGSGLQSYL